MADNKNNSNRPSSSRTVLIDGVIFQYYRGSPNGISRVWLSLIPHLQKILDGYSIVLIKRGQFSCGLMNVIEHPTNEYDFTDPNGGDTDTCLIDSIASDLKAVCFLSTYYTRSTACPNILLVHDMIPEVMQDDLSKPAWIAKKKAILSASSYIAVSDSTRRDLIRFYNIAENRVRTAYNGVTTLFQPSPAGQYSSFLAAKGIKRPYLLLVGGRGQYKGAIRFLRAFSRSCHASNFRIVAVGGEPWLSGEEEALQQSLNIIYTGWIPDNDLIQLYSGAFALVFPSMYEGFGLPVAEAMACGCPVILPNHSSLPEVAGDAGVFTDTGNKDQLENAITSLLNEKNRAILVERGMTQASKFRWPKMAEVFAQEIRRLKHPDPYPEND